MDVNKSVEVLKALADPARLDIVRKLAIKQDSVASCDVVKSCSSLSRLSQPAASHHFNKLVDAGILQELKIGTNKHYELNFTLLKDMGIDAKKI